MDPLLYPRRETFGAVPSAALSLKSSSMALQVPGVYGEAQQNTSTRLSALCTCLCPVLLNGCSMVAAEFLVLGEAFYPLPNVLQEEERFLLVRTRGSPHHTVWPLLQGLHPPSP